MAKPTPRDAAQGFASHLNTVLNATVTDARLTISQTSSERRFSIAYVDSGGEPAAFRLLGTDLSFLFHQVVEVRGHLHVNAHFTDEHVEQKTTKGASHLHIATGRVPVELVVWHLIAEWGVASRTDDWKSVLGDSLEGFEERQNAI